MFAKFIDFWKGNLTSESGKVVVQKSRHGGGFQADGSLSVGPFVHPIVHFDNTQKAHIGMLYTYTVYTWIYIYMYNIYIYIFFLWDIDNMSLPYSGEPAFA